MLEVCGRSPLAGTKVYADRAISGASRHRAQFQQMIADAETGRFDVIVCEALDRIGRNCLTSQTCMIGCSFAGSRCTP